MMTNYEALIEAVLFAAGEPVVELRLREILQIESGDLDKLLENLTNYYIREKRGLRLVRMNGKLQLVSAPEYADTIRRVLEERKPPPMSNASLETLAIVAYHQPVTRLYIEQMRNIDSSNTVVTLCEKGLIEECGRLEVPGRPILYRTTDLFLRSFGLRSLDELPGKTSDDGDEDLQLSLIGAEQ